MEQLFCLGLRNRSECVKLLEMCDWNLEEASTQILEDYGSITRQRCGFQFTFFELDLLGQMFKSETSFLFHLYTSIQSTYMCHRLNTASVTAVPFEYLFIVSGN